LVEIELFLCLARILLEGISVLSDFFLNNPQLVFHELVAVRASKNFLWLQVEPSLEGVHPEKHNIY